MPKQRFLVKLPKELADVVWHPSLFRPGDTIGSIVHEKRDETDHLRWDKATFELRTPAKKTNHDGVDNLQVPHYYLQIPRVYDCKPCTTATPFVCLAPQDNDMVHDSLVFEPIEELLYVRPKIDGEAYRSRLTERLQECRRRKRTRRTQRMPWSLSHFSTTNHHGNRSKRSRTKHQRTPPKRRRRVVRTTETEIRLGNNFFRLLRSGTPYSRRALRSALSCSSKELSELLLEFCTYHKGKYSLRSEYQLATDRV